MLRHVPTQIILELMELVGNAQMSVNHVQLSLAIVRPVINLIIDYIIILVLETALQECIAIQ